MLRRLKTQTLNGEALIKLPARNIEIRSCVFSESEQAFYGDLEKKMDNVLRDMSDEGKNDYIGVLVCLLRLRQCCNHPRLVDQDYKDDLDAIDTRASKGDDNGEVDPDDLAVAFGQMGVTKKCKLCQSE